MDAAHAAAEAIRASAGYSGGTDGSGNISTNKGSGSSSSSGSVSKGSTGSDVLAVQMLLIANGYSLVADGSFGPLTQAAVRDFQSKNGLQVDGVVGIQTSAALGVSIPYTKATNQMAAASNSTKPSSLPPAGTPNSVGKHYNPDGSLKQERAYGPNGQPVRDRDYNHSGKDLEFPHDHVWENGERGSEHIPVTDPEKGVDVTKVIVGGVAVAGTAYIIYRGVRMLPSLAPPLWWTIPANVVIP